MINSRATVKDVAKCAGVSIATVSHVINNTRYVSPQMRAKVEQAMKVTNYVPNHTARALRSDKTNTIGVVIPDVTNPFFATVVKALEGVLSQRGYSMLLCHSGDEYEKELKQLEILHAFRVDGIIIAPSSTTFDYSMTAVYGRCPMVFIDRKPKMPVYSGVFINFHDIVQNAVEQLIQSGHSSIGFMIGYLRFSTTEDRQQGYLDALKKHNIPIDQNFIVSGPTTESAGYEYMRYFLEKTDVTAVFVANRLMSLGAVRCLNELGVDIPSQMGIICLAVQNEIALSRPALTTVYTPEVDIGISAANLLLRRIRGEKLEDEKIILDGCMTARSSY